jgi:alpha-tubulin suppressor-like RCC1 family protein
VVEALQGVHISAVAAGLSHSLALSEAGEIYSFGRGEEGQLGHGNTVRQLTPLLVAAQQSVRVSTVAAGCTHSLALSEAGCAYSFGCGGHQECTIMYSM